MKRAIVAGALLLIAGSTQAFAVNNTDCSVVADQLSGNELTTLLDGTGNYAQDVADNNNETLSGGNVIDYKLGPPAAGNKDPTSVVGVYTISGATRQGTIAYNYPAAFSYQVSVLVQGANHLTIPATYLFCSGPLVKTINIKSGHF